MDVISVTFGSLCCARAFGRTTEMERHRADLHMVSIAESLRTWSNDTKVSFHGEPVLN